MDLLVVLMNVVTWNKPGAHWLKSLKIQKPKLVSSWLKWIVAKNPFYVQVSDFIFIENNLQGPKIRHPGHNLNFCFFRFILSNKILGKSNWKKSFGPRKQKVWITIHLQRQRTSQMCINLNPPFGEFFLVSNWSQFRRNLSTWHKRTGSLFRRMS